MKLTTLGGTGLKVSPICLGTMQFGWYVDERAAFSMMDFFVDAGGNFLDTADMYSNWAPGNPGGVSEQIIGRWLKSRKNRNRMVIATKCRGKMWEGKDGEGLSRSHILRACDDSLRRLGVDVIDVYQAHWDDDVVPQEETMAAFDRLVKDGKVRAIGISNFSADRLASALDAADRQDGALYQTNQAQYNLVYREDYEKATRAVCQSRNIACIPYSPLGGGLLTGKFHRKDNPDTHRTDYIKRYTSDKADRAVRRLIELADDAGVAPLQLALRWIMAQPTVVSPIVGASTNAQLGEILDSLKADIPEGMIGELTAASAKD
ncbi:aldo/keto reductase [bacterium]|nr:aldo/keto reductase [bacterium]